jgi:thymidylate synthase
VKVEILVLFFEDKDYLNQIELLIWTYKNKGHRNNQMVLQVAQPTDMLLQDPPCLRHIDTRIQDGKLHFYPYFRSWDLWGGLPANLGGIQLLKEYVAAEIGVEDGEIIASSKGLHIYDYSFDLAKCLRMRDDMKLKGE